MLKALKDHLTSTHERALYWIYLDMALFGWMGYKLWGPWLGLFS